MNKGLLAVLLSLSGCMAIFTTESGGNNAFCTDRRTPSSVLSDKSLELDLNKKLSDLGLNDDSRIYFKSFNRHIIVLGQTPNSEDIDKISSMIAHSDRVKKIYNELTNEKAIGYWQQAQDKWITAKITSSMLLAPQIKPWRLHVFTENNVVYLVGIVKPEEEELAVEIAKTTTGVQKVVKIFEYRSS